MPTRMQQLCSIRGESFTKNIVAELLVFPQRQLTTLNIALALQDDRMMANCVVGSAGRTHVLWVYGWFLELSDRHKQVLISAQALVPLSQE
jgi:hypothetical protein